MIIDRETELSNAKPEGLEAGPEAGWHPDRSVVLIGMMGAGKTSVGMRLARRLNLPFLDVDVEIERAANMSVAEIFATEGEAVFRSGERKIIARLLEGPVTILATGGGAFMDPQTRSRIKSQALSIWLKADLDTLLRRTARRNTRPLLLTGDPRQTLEDLMTVRHPVYAEADLMVESLPGSPDETARAVIAAIRAHYTKAVDPAPRIGLAQ